MIYKINDQIPLQPGDMLFTVSTMMNTCEYSFGVSNRDEHNIRGLKRALSSLIDADIIEMSIMVSPEYPYSLRDELPLIDILEHHRSFVDRQSFNEAKWMHKTVKQLMKMHQTEITGLNNFIT